MSDAETLAELRYFHLHGLKAEAPERLNAALKSAIDELEGALYGPSRTELTAGEVGMLEQVGVHLDERPDEADPMLDYATAFAAIRETSLTPATLARALGVTPVRIRQMIRNGSLYAIRLEGRLHIPAYQVDGRALIPNIGRVNQALAGLDPVSVQRWITAADPDLGDASPLDWLKGGRDVDAVLRVVPAP